MRNTILIADDIEMSRELLCMMLEDQYTILQAENGKEVLEIVEREQDSLCCVLLDLIMPELDGFGVLAVMKEKGWIDHIPVLVISGDDSHESESSAFDFGVTDFIRKPFDSVIVRKRVSNVVNLAKYRFHLEEVVAQQTQELTKQNKLLIEQAARLKKNNTDIIDTIGTIVEARHLESGEHVKRVKGFTQILGVHMQKLHPEYGLTDATLEQIVLAASLHDVGKIMISDTVLLKPGKLTAEEFTYMKTHTTMGCDILKLMNDMWDPEYKQYSYEICRWHHERFDGRGYPDGLKGDEIPISAQLVSVADVYDALVTERVYKKPFPKDVAFDMILGGQCGTFSPKLMECFAAGRAEMEAFADKTNPARLLNPD